MVKKLKLFIHLCFECHVAKNLTMMKKDQLEEEQEEENGEANQITINQVF